MKMILKSALAAGLMTASAPIVADSNDYALDGAHTSVQFYVNHLGFSNMQGEFNDVEATLTLDPDNIEATKLSATMQSVSVDMDHDQLNYHIRSSDFFDVLKHPTLTFVSTSVEKTGDTTAKMTGDLTMLGTTQPVTLDVSLTGEGVNPLSNNYTVAFHATGTLKRSAFGMEYLVGPIGDDVRIDISSELIRQ